MLSTSVVDTIRREYTMSTSVVVNTFRDNLQKKFPGLQWNRSDNNVGDQQTFADFLRERIKEKSQRDVARKAGLSPTTIGNYLLGRLPSLDDSALISRLAIALECRPDEIRSVVIAEQDERGSEEAMARLQQQDPMLNAIIAAYRSARHESARVKILEAAEKIAREEAEEEGEVPFEQ